MPSSWLSASKEESTHEDRRNGLGCWFLVGSLIVLHLYLDACKGMGEIEHHHVILTVVVSYHFSGLVLQCTRTGWGEGGCTFCEVHTKIIVV